MSSSAFDILIVPVVLGTLGSIFCGAAILAVLKTIEASAACLARAVRMRRPKGKRAERGLFPRRQRAHVERGQVNRFVAP